MERIGVVYAICCMATGQVYVGSSVDLGARLCEHRRLLSQGVHFNRRLQAAWDAHGEEEFSFDVAEVTPPATLGVAEERWIAKLHAADPECGFNVIAPGVRPALVRLG